MDIDTALNTEIQNTLQPCQVTYMELEGQKSRLYGEMENYWQGKLIQFSE